MSVFISTAQEAVSLYVTARLLIISPSDTFSPLVRPLNADSKRLIASAALSAEPLPLPPNPSPAILVSDSSTCVNHAVKSSYPSSFAIFLP